MQAGDLISGKYRLQQLLGSGSMGSVWSARNELTNRDFAVKFLLPGLAENPEALSRFFHEARACGQLRHPAIVDVFDMGRAEDGSPYLVMELLEGEGFEQHLSRQGCMRPVDLCRWMSIVARGLDEAHSRGLIHRDLKPGNIFFAIDGNGALCPKVLDFGISKEISAEAFDQVKTNPGTVLGSPAYMSPEQAQGEEEVDARTDLWSMGVIMYEALTAQLPFDASNYNALMVCIITEPHTPLSRLAPGVPAELEQLIDELLTKERDDRTKTARQVAERLERIYQRLTDTPLAKPERNAASWGTQTTHNYWYRLRSRTGGRWTPAVLAFLGLVLVVGVVSALVAVLRPASASLPTVSRFSGSVSALMARANIEYNRLVEASTEARIAASAKAAKDANKKTDEPEPDGGKTARPAGGQPRGTDPNDPHGGVDSAGF